MRIAPAKPLFIARCFLNFSGKHSLRSATITRRLTSITKTYPASGFEVPPSSSHHFVVSKTLKGIRRSIGTAQEGKAPLLTSDIRRIVACCHQTLSGLPDQALVLVGFAGNVNERDIMRQTGHKSAEMLAKYIRIGEMFARNAAAGLGI